MNMDKNLRALIEKPAVRHQCVFWNQTMEAVKQNGASSVSRIKSQFSNFEETRPG